VSAISEARWQVAQQHEAAWWANEARSPEKFSRDIRGGHHFTAGVLDIRLATVCGLSVLDIAGGPMPLGMIPDFFLGRYVVLDPAVYPDVDIERIRERAEGWRGGRFDEVWGYNVLQHVVDPAEVMATARACALHTIRWFDVVETAIYPVHPHSIRADWLRAEMSKDGFRIVRDLDGSRLVEGARQKWVALVAERQA
jgi:hypothetical protein